MDIKTLYETTEFTLEQICSLLKISRRKLFKYIENNYTKEFQIARKKICYRNSKIQEKNPQFGKFGENSSGYKGLVSDCKGYHMMLKPFWYTGRKKSKHVFCHHLVICEKLGLSQIPHKWCVHHCDENKLNNSFTNLVLMTTSDHMKLHGMLKGATTISKESTLKWVEAHGTPFKRDDIVCSIQECIAAKAAGNSRLPVNIKESTKSTERNETLFCYEI